NRLVAGNFRRRDEGSARHFASYQTIDVALSRNRMGRDLSDSSGGGDNSARATSMAVGRWRRLHGWRVIFCEQTCALLAFYLAFVRSRRFELPLRGGNFLHRLISARDFGWTRRRDALIT